MIFINTRPRERAANLTQFLQQHAVTVQDLSLLELTEKPLTPLELQSLQRLWQSSYQAVFLVSETAVSYGLHQLAQVAADFTAIANVPFVAVGQKTAQFFLAQWPFYSAALPTMACPTQENNDGMLAMPLVKALKTGDRVQVWRGVGGRDVLIEALRERGVTVDVIELYARRLPVGSQQRFLDCLAAASGEAVVVLISSLAAWQHWQQLLAQAQISPSRFDYMVLQSRVARSVAAIVSDTEERQVKVIDDLQPMTVLATLTEWVVD